MDKIKKIKHIGPNIHHNFCHDDDNAKCYQERLLINRCFRQHLTMQTSFGVSDANLKNFRKYSAKYFLFLGYISYQF